MAHQDVEDSVWFGTYFKDWDTFVMGIRSKMDSLIAHPRVDGLLALVDRVRYNERNDLATATEFARCMEGQANPDLYAAVVDFCRGPGKLAHLIRKRVCPQCRILRTLNASLEVTETSVVVSSLSPYVSHFFGREDDLRRVLETLAKAPVDRATIVITGIGGIGKTNLAAKVIDSVNRHHFWISCKELESASDIRKVLLRRLGLGLSSNNSSFRKAHGAGVDHRGGQSRQPAPIFCEHIQMRWTSGSTLAASLVFGIDHHKSCPHQLSNSSYSARQAIGRRRNRAISFTFYYGCVSRPPRPPRLYVTT